MSDKTEELVHQHDLEPDPEPDEVPTAILEEDEDAQPSGMTLQTIAFGLGIFLIILLVLLLASGGSINLFKIFQRDSSGVNVNTQLPPLLANGAPVQSRAGAASNGAYYGVDGLGTLPDYSAEIDPLLLAYWVRNGGETIFGRPISPLLEENGRKFQWFERARLELWPEYAGTKYEIQPGRIGVEFTKGVDFPNQEFFVNRSGLRYAEVTQHGLRGAFLEFWEKNGGVDIFGYPVSDEIQEILPEDNAYHTVQYFERGRMELHPADENQPIKLGLLGTALFKQDSAPELEPIKPTPVPPTP
jgi:hypothetical protein